MSVRIFKDIEEALSREVRRLTYHDNTTQTETVLQDAFDPITGEIVQVPIEPNYYDSSANANNINYPNIFVKLLRTREDRFSGKVVPQYGKDIAVPVATSPRAFEIVANGLGTMNNGNDLTSSLLKIHSIQAGYLLRVLSGSNQGTYTIASTTPDSGGSHVISVSSDIVDNLPGLYFDSATREVIFSGDVDLNSVKPGDDFIDFATTSFTIVSVDALNNKIEIGGIATPDLSDGSKITRPGNVFVEDLTLTRYLVLDPSKPIIAQVSGGSTCDSTSSFTNVSASIPIDAYYLIRVDSKERKSHIEILNRMWEEFNPPRTGLPVVVRSKLSSETLLTVDVGVGGSQTITVESNTEFSVGDPVVIFDDLSPSKNTSTEGFERPFSSVVTEKIGTDQLVLEDTVPDKYIITNCSRVVSNAELQILMFHFVDHKTRDVESAQYWVHEFTFWVQTFVDRLGDIAETGVVTDISTEEEIL